MAYPYYPYFYYPYMADPAAMIYMLQQLWLSYISIAYYMEMYRLMIDTWRKFMETGFGLKPASPTP